MTPLRMAAVAVGGAVLAGALWWRKHPSACPYGQRFWVQPPHPLITRARLREVLAPEPGERVLEVGPGTGYYTLDMAEWVGPGGDVAIFDLQQEMLDHTMRRAGERGLSNITQLTATRSGCLTPMRASTRPISSPCSARSPTSTPLWLNSRALLRPGGRLVVGELFGDPHWVSPTKLQLRGERAGLVFEQRSGSRFGYFARLRLPGAT